MQSIGRFGEGPRERVRAKRPRPSVSRAKLASMLIQSMVATLERSIP